MKQIKEAKKGHVSPYKRDRKFEKEYMKTKKSLTTRNNWYRIDDPRVYTDIIQGSKTPLGQPQMTFGLNEEKEVVKGTTIQENASKPTRVRGK